MSTRKFITISGVCENCHCKFQFRSRGRKSDKSRKYCSTACYFSGRARRLEDRFLEKIGEPDKHGCWPWTATKNNKGYGMMADKTGIKMRLAHRISWELVYGPIPEGLLVLHHCDNPGCVNPAHLFLGTQQDNMQDMARKERQGLQRHPELAARGDRHSSKTHPERVPKGDKNGSRKHPERLKRGESHPLTTFTNADVARIRELYSSGTRTYESLSKEYQVSIATVWRIVKRVYWKHLQ
jgi:hypothetical protein